MKTKMRWLCLGGWLAATATACGPSETPIETLAQAMVTAGSDAAPVFNNIPAAVNPGERLNVRVSMRNDGTASPANDWSSNFFLYSRNAPLLEWGFVSIPTPATTTPGNTADFDFVITAPSTTDPATDFGVQMFEGGGGFFGTGLVVSNIDVNAGNQRRWDCSVDSDTIPGTMLPGETQSVSVTLRNTGSGTWSNTGLCLYSRDNAGPSGDFFLWGADSSCVNLTSSVVPNGTTTLAFDITAPSTAGTYQLARQIFDSNSPNLTNGVGLFDAVNNCLDRTIVVGAASDPYASSFVSASSSIPTSLQPGERATVTVALQNTGSETWIPNEILIYSRNSPLNEWGVVNANLSSSITSGNTASFTFSITAPSTPGSYTFNYQLIRFVNPFSGFFGELVSVPITVAAVAPVFDSAVVSQNIPSTILTSGFDTFSMTFQNTGTATWNPGEVRLFDANTTRGLWTTSVVDLPNTVTPGNSVTFSFTILAPSTPGNYDSNWQLQELTGTGLFGAVASTTGIFVGSACGNSNIDNGETCDDGNTVAGDGCSELCMIESQTIDLASASDRVFPGTLNLGQMGSVVIGDFEGNATTDIVVGEGVGTSTLGASTRVFAGTIYGYTGGADFFNVSSTTVPTGAAFQVIGADANDFFGAGFYGRIFNGDVTGDSVNDVIVAAPRADGVGNARIDAGEIFIIGGGGLGSAGYVDLSVTPVGTGVVQTRIIGPEANAQLTILAIGDLSGDGIADIVVGSPDSSPSARALAGTAYIVQGGAGLVGQTIDLAAGTTDPNVLAVIIGSQSGDRLGRQAAIGNIGGGTSNDVVFGVMNHSPGGLTRAGGAWALFDNPSGTIDLASTFDVRWIGGDNTGQLGSAVAIGNVTGTDDPEIIFGGNQLLNPNFTLPSSQRGRVDVWSTPVAAGTFDLGAGATPDSRIFGVEFGDLFGNSVTLGNVNGDGYLDMIIGAHGADGASNGRDRAGEAFLVIGQMTLDATIDIAAGVSPLRLIGPRNNGLVGRLYSSVAVGDLDADGRDDICVGASNGVGSVDCFQSPY